MGVADDLVVIWEVVEQEWDGTTIRHSVGLFKYALKQIKSLRRNYSNYAAHVACKYSLFYIRPYGLAVPTIDLTRHEC